MNAKKKILVVEDNAGNRLLMRYNLEGHFDVDFANNGFSALNKISENNYDLILMDIQLPEMDGIETTKQIRLLEKGHHIPIFAITSNIYREQKAACLNAGMDEYISKPVHTKALIDKINHYLMSPVHFEHL
ncbi:MAG: response regulator [Prolixibacteraceae bacterium]|jgi:CheY-like chemotaxis protein|nr:response regulator [Prolixibacteraceae bacterium]